MIVLILLTSILTNCSVIINIINSDIKKSIVTFVIIKNLCIVDLCGACLILPAPLVATIQGKDLSGNTLCLTMPRLVDWVLFQEGLISFLVAFGYVLLEIISRSMLKQNTYIYRRYICILYDEKFTFLYNSPIFQNIIVYIILYYILQIICVKRYN